jgi:hypothetical protein
MAMANWPAPAISVRDHEGFPARLTEPEPLSGRWPRFLRRAGGRRQTTDRVAGRPPSANAASSLHLIWELPALDPVAEVGVTLLVPEVPAVRRLYFWALQVSTSSGAGAHLGLQWGADAPRRMRHVNWGGYGRDGRELSGSTSALSSSFGNPNTRDYDWEPGRPYRLRISSDGDGWAGWVDDTLVRHLDLPDGALVGPMVWSEVFADCDHPAVSVHWSDPTVTTASAQRVPIRAAVAHYQSVHDGGCTNTSSTVDGDAFVQTTSTSRLTPAGARLVLAER